MLLNDIPLRPVERQRLAAGLVDLDKGLVAEPKPIAVSGAGRTEEGSKRNDRFQPSLALTKSRVAACAYG